MKPSETRVIRILESIQSICDELIEIVREQCAEEDPLPPPANVPQSPTDEQNTLMTRQQAGEYLRVSPDTLAVWATTGRYDLPYVKIGRRVMYRKVDLDAFIEQRVRVRT